MATPTVNFISYNSTGMDSVKVNWIKTLCKVSNIDFIGLQEHFKSTKTVDKYFKEHFDEYNTFVVPACRSENQDSGRPKGGLVQMSKKNIKIKIDRIKTNNFRIQAQILHLPRKKLL